MTKTLPPSLGQTIENFSLLSDVGTEFLLKDYFGYQVVIYFYPKDSTPGCTLESQGFRDNIKMFDKVRTKVIGISKDKVASHQRFKDKYALPFVLLADTQAVLCHYFDVIKSKTLYGRLFRGIERSTFLLDSGHCLCREWRKVRVRGHVEDVLEAASELFTQDSC